MSLKVIYRIIIAGVCAAGLFYVLLEPVAQAANLIFAGQECASSDQAICYDVDNSAPWQRWENVGPGGGGWFMDAALGISGAILVASDLGSLFYSENDGASWTQLGAVNGLTPTHISSVAFHPTDSDTFFAGTDSGLFRTSNNGETFTNVLSGGRICSVSIGETVSYASRALSFDEDCNEILVSDGAGTAWTSAGFLPVDTHILNIRINQINNDRALFVSQSGRFFNYGDGALESLHETADGGVSFNQVNLNGLPVYDAQWSTDGAVSYITTREVDNNADGIGDGGASDGVTGAAVGQLISKLAGYNSVQTVLNTDRTGLIWIPAGTTNVIRLVDRRFWGVWMTPDEGMFESIDGGISFTQISSVVDYDWGWTTRVESNQIPGVKGWEFSESDPDKAIYINTLFVRGSIDGGLTFSELSTTNVSGNQFRTTGINNTNGIVVAQHPLNPDFVMLGYADLGCWRSENGGSSWEECNQAGVTGSWNGTGGTVRAIVMDPDDVNKVWITSNHTSDVIIRSTSGGVDGSWVEVTTGLPATITDLDDLALDDTSPAGSRQLFAAADGDVYRSTNDGSDWSLVYACGDCYRLAVDGASNTVLAGGGSGLYRSTADGAFGTWSAVIVPGFTPSGLGRWTANSYEGITNITNDTRTPGLLYFTAKDSTTGGVFRYDAGTVTRLYTNHYVQSVAVDTLTGDLYAGLSKAGGSGGYNVADGMIVSSDDGASWNEFETPLTNKAVRYVYLPPADETSMWIQDPGNGFWKVSRVIDATAPALSTLTVSPTEQAATAMSPLTKLAVGCIGW